MKVSPRAFSRQPRRDLPRPGLVGIRASFEGDEVHHDHASELLQQLQAIGRRQMNQRRHVGHDNRRRDFDPHATFS